MKNFYLCILILFLTTANVFSQILDRKIAEKEKVSGYLGMKNVVQVKGMFSVSNQPQKPKVNINTRIITLNKEFEMNLERVLSSRNACGILIGNSYTSVKLKLYDYQRTLDNEQVESVISTPKIRDIYYGLKYKHFNQRKGGLAPVGRYWAVNYSLHNYKVDLSNVTFLIHGWNTLYRLKNGIHKYKISEFGISSGVNRIIFKRIVLDYGIHFGLINSHRVFKAVGIIQDPTNLTIEEFIKDKTLVRLTRYHFMKLYLSIGYAF